jgi:hypothetical protein
MKRAILLFAAALIALNTLAIPTVAKADGGVGTTGCGMTLCKPK